MTHHGLHHHGSAVHCDLKHVLSRVTSRSGKEGGNNLVENGTIVRVGIQQIPEVRSAGSKRGSANAKQMPSNQGCATSRQPNDADATPPGWGCHGNDRVRQITHFFILPHDDAQRGRHVRWRATDFRLSGTTRESAAHGAEVGGLAKRPVAGQTERLLLAVSRSPVCG